MASVFCGRLSRGISWVCAAILYITFGAIFCILCADVILRYFSGSSLRWASEIPELLFPWLVMAGVVMAAQHGAHIATTFLADAVHGKARQRYRDRRPCRDHRRLQRLAVVTAQAIPIVADERSPILGVPGSVTYLCLLAGFVLIALVHLGELLHWVKAPTEHVTGAYQ